MHHIPTGPSREVTLLRQRPWLTIILPVLNCLGVVRRALDSIVSQDASDYEVLAIDGGSTDGTTDLIRQYPGIRLVSESDDGIYDAMNKGVRLAFGKWVYFLGSDDYLIDDAVLSDIKYHLNGDLDVVYGDIWDEHMQHRWGGAFSKFSIARKNICHQSIFFRRDVFERIGFFDCSYPSYADWDHNMKWMLNPGIRKKHVERIVAVYAGKGFSHENPDAQFQRDRFFRYLTYGRGVIPSYYSLVLWGIEMGLGLLHLDVARLKRGLGLLGK